MFHFSKLFTKTNYISKTYDMGPCACDLTFNVCDNYCCCDADCPISLIQVWNTTFFNQCVNKSK